MSDTALTPERGEEVFGKRLPWDVFSNHILPLVEFDLQLLSNVCQTSKSGNVANLQESPEYVTSLPFWGQLPLKKLKKLVKNNKETYPSLLRANTFDISGEWADFQFYANKDSFCLTLAQRDPLNPSEGIFSITGEETGGCSRGRYNHSRSFTGQFHALVDGAHSDRPLMYEPIKGAPAHKLRLVANTEISFSDSWSMGAPPSSHSTKKESKTVWEATFECRDNFGLGKLLLMRLDVVNDPSGLASIYDKMTLTRFIPINQTKQPLRHLPNKDLSGNQVLDCFPNGWRLLFKHIGNTNFLTLPDQRMHLFFVIEEVARRIPRKDSDTNYLSNVEALLQNTFYWPSFFGCNGQSAPPFNLHLERTLDPKVLQNWQDIANSIIKMRADHLAQIKENSGW